MNIKSKLGSVSFLRVFVNSILVLLLVIFTTVILAVSLRGNPGNPDETSLNTLAWKDNGPLELSPERGRFALTYSIVEDNSVHFSVPIARFATPDLGYKDSHYVSLFAQGVSYLVVPGFVRGSRAMALERR
jgi:hypothetical protein